MSDVMVIQPVPEGRRVTCWVKKCAEPAEQLISIQGAFGLPPGSFMALCDRHLVDFMLDTAEWPA